MIEHPQLYLGEFPLVALVVFYVLGNRDTGVPDLLPEPQEVWVYEVLHLLLYGSRPLGDILLAEKLLFTVVVYFVVLHTPYRHRGSVLRQQSPLVTLLLLLLHSLGIRLPYEHTTKLRLEFI